MQPSRPDIHPTPSLLVLVFAAALAGRVEAEPIATPRLDAEAHARACKCAARCRGEACCCGRSSNPSRQPPASATAPTPTPPESARGGPCLGEAPCQDPGLPVPTTSAPTARVAALMDPPSRRPSSAGALLPPPASPLLRTACPARIDRPPRG